MKQQSERADDYLSCDGAAVFTPSIDEGLLDGDESVAMEAIDEGQGLSIVFVSQVNLN
jgi:hypothetical protein